MIKRSIILHLLLCALAFIVSNTAWADMDRDSAVDNKLNAVGVYCNYNDYRSADYYLNRIDVNQIKAPLLIGKYWYYKAIVKAELEQDSVQICFDKAWEYIDYFDKTEVAVILEQIVDYDINVRGIDHADSIASTLKDEWLVGTSPVNQIRVCYLKGMVNGVRGDFAENIRYWRIALDAYYGDNDKTEEERAYFVEILWMLNHYDECYTLLSIPEYRDLLYLLGVVRNFDEEYENAARSLEKAISLSNNNVFLLDTTYIECIDELRNSYVNMMPLSDAAHALDSVLAGGYETVMPPDIRRFWLYHKGKCKYEMGLGIDAANFLEDAIRISHDNEWYDRLLVTIVNTLYNCCDGDIISFERAMNLVDLDKADVSVRPRLRYHKALLEFNRGDTIAAKDILELSRKEYIDNGLEREQYYMMICYNLAQAYSALGDNEALEECLNGVIVDCEGLMDARPELARNYYYMLHGLYKERGDIIMADRIFYTKLLQYIIKDNNEDLSGILTKQELDDYNYFVGDYHGGQNEYDITILSNFGNIMLSFDLESALICYNDCLKKDEKFDGSHDLSEAHAGRITVAIRSMKNDTFNVYGNFNNYYNDALRYASSVDNEIFNIGELEIYVGDRYFDVWNNNHDDMVAIDSAEVHYNRSREFLDERKVSANSFSRLKMELGLACCDLAHDDVSTLRKVLYKIEKKKVKEISDQEKKDELLYQGYELMGEKLLDNKLINDAVYFLNEAFQHSKELVEKEMLLEKLLEALETIGNARQKAEVKQQLKEIKKILYGRLTREEEIKLN